MTTNRAQLPLWIAMIGIVCVGAAIVWGMEQATSVALAAANEKGVAHNGLLERMREQAATYLTKTEAYLAIGLAVSLTALAWQIWGHGR